MADGEKGRSAATPRALEEGDEIAGYRVEGKLGEGGCATVYTAYHVETLETVALKMLHGQHRASEDLVPRFLAEARVAIGLEHPNVARVFAAGEHQGLPYIVMEQLDGEPLSDRLKDGATLLPQDALNFTLQAASALRAAHERGVVHRDVTPGNLFVTQCEEGEQIKLLDFGIAKIKDPALGAGVQTKTGSMLGTPHYMSPEQCVMRKDIDGRADVYSLGVVLFQMLTGQLPFSSDTLAGLVLAHMHEDPPSPSSLVPALPGAVEQLVLRMLCKEREHRFATMAELEAALRDVLAGAFRSVDDAKLVVEGYLVGRALGCGNVTESFAAFHEHDGREAVVKFVNATDRVKVNALFGEAQKAAELGNRHIGGLIHTGYHEGRPYVIQHKLKGESAAAFLTKRVRMPESDVVRVGLQLADALKTAHAAGLVHGNLSANNVIIAHHGGAELAAALTDFGSWHMLGRAGLAQTIDMGAHPHLPPESDSALGDPKPTVDIFSLGALLYRLLVIQEPFDRDSQPVRTGRLQRAERRAVPPRKRCPNVSASMEGVLLRALAPKPRDRFDDMAGFHQALEYLSGSHREVARAIDGVFGTAAAEERVLTAQERSEQVADKLCRLLDARLKRGELELPVMPTGVGRALSMIDNPSNSLRKVSEVLDQDPVLVAQVLRVANSPMFMGAGKAATIDHAVTRLGVGNLRAVLVECSARCVFQSRVASIRREVDEIWKHCVAVASVTREVARKRMGPDPALAYISGLLHDVGKPIVGGVLLDLEKHLAMRDRKFMDHDMWVRVVSESHRTVGLSAVRQWDLPEEIAQGIEFCGAYDRSEPDALSNYVCLANAIAKRERPYNGLTSAEQIEETIKEGCELLGVQEEALGRFSELAQQAA